MPGIDPIELLVLLVIGLGGTAFWIWMIIECITKERDPDRLVWIVIIGVTHFIGAAIYFVIRRPRRIAHSGSPPG
jgi:hypothetical protein